MTSRTFREHLARRVKSAHLTIEPEVADQLEVYFRLLVRWNVRVNLTALRLDEPTDDTFDRLFVEPLAAARQVQDSWTPWFDVGSGGGSPAIPLKLVKPVLRLTMVESTARKAAFLREAVRSLGLMDTSVETARFEELASRPDIADTAGVVTIRAVRPDLTLLNAAARILRDRGVLLLFRPSPRAERYDGFEDASSTVLVPTQTRPAYLLTYQRSHLA